MSHEDDKLSINLGYPLSQLARALFNTSESGQARVAGWQQVIAGMLHGTLRIGSRTPVANVPPWVTLEVLHGGFATGNFSAGGALQAHELEKLDSLPGPAKEAGRAALNLFYVGDAGRAELLTMLRAGLFRLQVPEEGALLVVAWLIDRGEAERAEQLIDVLLPFFDRLRFYPVPHARPLSSEVTVHVQTAGEVVERLRAKRLHVPVEQMKEALQVWTPLYDRAVELFLETVDGETPSLQTDAEGKLVRRPDGNPIIEGGWPCRRFADDWDARARALLLEYEDSRRKNHLCGKPERRKENFTRLRGFLTQGLQDRASLTGREVGMIRKILASFVTAHGAPGSDRRQATRAMQDQLAAQPTHCEFAGVVAQRLGTYPPDEGVPDLEPMLRPLAAEAGTPAGVLIPPSVRRTAMRCLEAPLATLVEKELVSSGEAMAVLLPTITGRTRAAAIASPELQRIYQGVYTAFRRRRSLLLLNLESQAKLSELPWIAALQPWVGADEASRQAAREVLIRTTSLALTAFPYCILPNKLIKELRALAGAAGESFSLVEELAADIFMGAFSESFLRSAQVAAQLLRGTLYERYYDLNYDQVLALNDLDTKRFGVAQSPGFATLCAQRVGDGGRGARRVVQNGMIIEQAQILTTHNLAILFDRLGLVRSLKAQLPHLARQCFAWICRRQQLKIKEWQAELQLLKNTAYAWRQMLFFLSLLDESAVGEFLEWSAAHLANQREEFQRRFEPAMTRLRVSAGREAPAAGGRMFLGWTSGRHWLQPARERVPAAGG